MNTDRTHAHLTAEEHMTLLEIVTESLLAEVEKSGHSSGWVLSVRGILEKLGMEVTGPNRH